MSKSRSCCCVYGCNTTPSKHPNAQFHRFPPENIRRIMVFNNFGFYEIMYLREAWIMRLGLKKKLSHHMRVCSYHFANDDYRKKELQKGRRLRPFAVPSLNLPGHLLKKVLTTKSTSRQKLQKHFKSVILYGDDMNKYEVCCGEKGDKWQQYLSDMAKENLFNDLIGKSQRNKESVGSSLCRLCGDESENVTEIFGETGKALNLPTKVKYLPFKVTATDLLPTTVCEQCLKKLIGFHRFIDECVMAGGKLLNVLNLTNNDAVREEVAKEWVDEESEEEIRKRVLEQFDEFHMVDLSSNRSLDFSYNAAIENDYSKMTMCSTNSIISKPEFVCQVCGHNLSSALSLKAHESAHNLLPNENGAFVCEECGLRIKSRYHLCLHQRIHQMTHKCKICSKRFQTLPELATHTAKHEENTQRPKSAKKPKEIIIEPIEPSVRPVRKSAEKFKKEFLTSIQESDVEMEEEYLEETSEDELQCNENEGKMILLQNSVLPRIKFFSRSQAMREAHRSRKIAKLTKEREEAMDEMRRNLKMSLVKEQDEVEKDDEIEYDEDMIERLEEEDEQEEFQTFDYQSKFSPATNTIEETLRAIKDGLIPIIIANDGNIRRISAEDEAVRDSYDNERRFACRTCGFRFKIEGDCRSHERNHHDLHDHHTI